MAATATRQMALTSCIFYTAGQAKDTKGSLTFPWECLGYSLRPHPTTHTHTHTLPIHALRAKGKYSIQAEEFTVSRETFTSI